MASDRTRVATKSVVLMACALMCSHVFATPGNGTGRKLMGVAAPGGACGSSNGGNTCPSGQCCSQYGWCGETSAHCGSGCQAQYSAGGTCSTTSVGTTGGTSNNLCSGTAPAGGACGSGAGSKCCPSGQCCSQYGWCGETSGHCGSGCQAAYSAGGTCSTNPITGTEDVTTTGVVGGTGGGSCSGTAPAGGACGSGAGGKCCPSGQCCSQYGWCGETSGHCGSGCQATYSAGGTCSTNPITGTEGVTTTGVVVGTSSKATYYFRVGADVPGCVPVQDFTGAYGSCGLQYNSGSKYWAAISNGKAYCGRRIQVSYGGRSVTLTVQDSCPGCAGDNHVDMGLEALIELTGSKEAACAINQGLPQVTWGFI